MCFPPCLSVHHVCLVSTALSCGNTWFPRLELQVVVYRCWEWDSDPWRESALDLCAIPPASIWNASTVHELVSRNNSPFQWQQWTRITNISECPRKKGFWNKGHLVQSLTQFQYQGQLGQPGTHFPFKYPEDPATAVNIGWEDTEPMYSQEPCKVTKTESLLARTYADWTPPMCLRKQSAWRTIKEASICDSITSIIQIATKLPPTLPGYTLKPINHKCSWDQPINLLSNS